MQKKSRGILIAGNWKMNHGPRETAQFYQAFKDRIDTVFRAEDKFLLEHGLLKVGLFVPFISLEKAKSQADGLDFPTAVGAQNAHWEKSGAFTGEISGPMLQELGIEWTLVG